MFKKTRTRLTLLNAVVFFIIIACLGIIVYTELRHQLYAKVDESLQLRIQQDPQLFYAKTQMMPEEDKLLPNTATKKTLIQVQGIDPRVFLVLWDDQGNAIPVMGSAGMHDAVKAFKPYVTASSPQTVMVDGHAYRLITNRYDHPRELSIAIMNDPTRLSDLKDPSQFLESASKSTIVAVQAISIIDSEKAMLKELLELILIGIAVGGAITVLAGLYLANQALRPIRRSWERQQQFVADASHELRMPLSIIRANAERVFRHPDRSILEMSEPLSMVLEESKRMGRLAEQLLTLARADSDQEELSLKPTSLRTVIDEVVHKFATLAELKGVALTAELENGLELLADGERMHQLLVILLDNSLKFTPDGGTIRVTARRRHHNIDIAVEDSGIGIAAEELPRIFDRFYHGDVARTRSQGGTGLGLAIAKWIAEKHGGELIATSVLGRGTVMKLQIPVKSAQLASASISSKSAPDA
ncbi:sensor histidine kinase [Paenibacillus ferrarius]|uniref:sensor histidine kinase n=1 Tax=Paenibacillus ferrarius TaxID=1469647 RepID=UPI003D2B6B02